MRGIWISALLWLAFITCLVFSCATDSSKREEGKEVELNSKGRAYIDPISCKPCHSEIVDQYLQTGKGRSFYPAIPKWSLENWNLKPISDLLSDLNYLPFQRDSSFFVMEYKLEGKDTVHKLIQKIDFFIGSGNQTRSYLCNKNGYLFEIPITWYSKKRIWDLSPGYENGQNTRFGRPIGEECMQCHNSGFEIRPNSLNRYSDFGHALACESCHGDVSVHFEEMKVKGGSVKSKPVSLGRLPVQAQFDVCRQCHLEGIKVRKKKAKEGDYEPAKLLSDYYEVFIPTEGESGDFGFASHAERLQQSKCFQKSGEKLTCITCHNPHAKGPESVDFYNQACRNCHATGHEKVCPKSPEMEKADCKSCHMKVSGTSDIPHVSSTDHWIRRNPEQISDAKKGSLVFRNFAGKNTDSRDLLAAKLAYVETKPNPQILAEIEKFLQELEPEAQVKFFYLSGKSWQGKLDTLQLAQSKNPFTVFYWSQLKLQSNLTGGLFLLEKACQMAPEMVEFQFKLAVQKLKSGNAAQPFFEKVLALQPDHAKSRTNLGFFALSNKQYSQAESQFKLALQSEPDYLLARENLVRCYLEQGKFNEAKLEINRLIRKNPGEFRYQRILESLP